MPDSRWWAEADILRSYVARVSQREGEIDRLVEAMQNVWKWYSGSQEEFDPIYLRHAIDLYGPETVENCLKAMALSRPEVGADKLSSQLTEVINHAQNTNALILHLSAEEEALEQSKGDCSA